MPPTTDSPDQPGSDRINELYWNSDRTIGDITDDLGISRNALYTSIHPLAAGTSCPACDRPMVFTNRTHRDSGMAVCGECGAEADLRGDSAGASRASRSGATRSSARAERPSGNGHEGESGWSRWREDLAAVEPERYALVGGAAALGVMLGAVAARALRHRM